MSSGRKSFTQRVFAYIDSYKMLDGATKVVCGVSGGADSVCMLCLLSEYRRQVMPYLSLQVIHVEHGLRGEESFGDAAFVEALCASLKVPCRVVHIRADEVAAAASLTVEEAGRQERYRIFCQEAGEDPSVRIAVAHHMEDQAETVLFQLVRGSGLAGLSGMHPVRDNIIRPLLGETRDGIEAYLGEIGQDFRSDATNLSGDNTRSRIRTQILPLLTTQVNERSVEHICEAAARANDADSYLQHQADAFCSRWVQCSDNEVSIDVDALRGEERLLQEYILRSAIRMLRGGEGLKNVGAVHISDMIALAYKGRGKRLDLPGLLKCRRVDRLLVLHVENVVQ